MKAWLTPNSLPDRISLCLLLPESEELLACFWGAFELLSFENEWQQYGTKTPAETSEYFRNLFFDNLNGVFMGCVSIGTIVYWSGDITDLPDNYLVVDGSDVAIDDYPKLYAIYGDMWGTSIPDHFKLPNLIDRFIVAVGNDYDLGDTGGESEHTLSIDEMPIHNHSYLEAVTGINLAGELPEPILVSNIPSVTGDTGGSEPHENRPPYFGLWVCVIAK